MRIVTALRSRIRTAEATGRRVRAVGANTSLSNHLRDEVVLHTEAYDAVLPLWKGLRPTCHPESLVQVECGIKVYALSKVLRERGRMLQNTAAFTGQTVVGAMATASHGTGVTLPPMCDQVVSMVLVTRGGEGLRLEPANGPTDPGHHHEPGLALVQDDRLFHSALTGLGAFGIVAAVTLRTLPDVPLVERREVHTLEAAMAGALADPFAHRHVSMLFNPMPHRGVRTAAVTVRDAAPRLRVLDVLQPRQRLVPLAFSHLPFDIPVRAWMKHLPSEAPSVLDAALRSTARGPVRAAAHRILDNWPLNRCAPARAAECFVPLDQWQQAVADLLDVAEVQASRGRYLTAPISVRFVGASQHLLAPTYREAGVMFEIVHLQGTAHEDTVMNPYVDALSVYGGRMHFGLETPGLAGTLGERYAELPAWRQALRRLNPGPAFELPRFLEAA